MRKKQTRDQKVLAELKRIAAALERQPVQYPPIHVCSPCLRQHYPPPWYPYPQPYPYGIIWTNISNVQPLGNTDAIMTNGLSNYQTGTWTVETGN